MQHSQRQQRRRQAPFHRLLLGLALAAPAAAAAPFDLGDGATLAWNNELRLGTLVQFNAISPAAYCSANCGYDAGFSQGRADWQSELVLTQGNGSLHVGLDARKEAVEAGASYLELFQAYGESSFSLAGRPLTVAIGRQSVIWGESRLFAANAIAGAQAPIDSSDGRSAVGYDAAIRFLPVAQASLAWQVTPALALLFYQQAEWRPNRVDRHDAYAGAGDLLEAQAGPLVAFDLYRYGRLLYRRADGVTPSGRDQFGVGLRGQLGDVDLGLYALRFDAKTPSVAYDGDAGVYRLNAASGIGLAGASLAAPLGDASLYAEISGRHRMPLVSGGLYSGYDGALGPRGDTLQGQIGLNGAVAPARWLPAGADWTVELAGNHLVAATDDGGQLAPGRSRSAAGLRGVLTPHVYQLWPRLDLALPISVGWNFLGRSALLPEMNRGTGDLGFGAVFDLDRAWSLGLTVTHYFGADAIPLSPLPSHGGRLSQWDDAGLTLKSSF